MNDSPKVTIVTTNFNGGQFIEETIKSVLNQSYENIEYIIIDGGSTDNSVEIIKKYQGRLAFWVSEPDKGMYDAINKGFSKATGSIFAYLNSDDLLYPEAVEKVINAHITTKSDFYYGHTTMIDQGSKVLYSLKTPNFSKKLFRWTQRLPLNQQSCFWTRKAFEEIGGFHMSYKLSADFHFFYFFFKDEKYKVCRVDSFLGKFRLHSTTLSSKFAEKMKEETIKFLTDHDILDTSIFGRIKRIYSESLFKAYNFKKYVTFNFLKKNYI